MLSLIKQNGATMVIMNAIATRRFAQIQGACHDSTGQSQHQRVVRLARLAMLIECEGSITIGMCPPTKTRNRPALAPTVDITNTAEEIIDEAKDTLIEEGVGFSIKGKRKCAGVGRKIRYDINIHGFDRVEGVLNAVLPYLRSKKIQAELALEFIQSRRDSEQKSQYSDHEWSLTTEIRRLNGRMPEEKAVAKALAAISSPDGPNRPRTTEYFRKYVEMCQTLQKKLAA